MTRSTEGPADHIETVGRIAADLKAAGLAPVLVGGMALVLLGSRRVTRDFDFVIPQPGHLLAQLLDVMYDRGLELASRVDTQGDVTATITSRRIAAIRLRIDRPASAYFFNSRTGLRIDLLFDYPLPAAELAERGWSSTVRGHRLCIAAEEDLLGLKKLALADRSAPGDVVDVAFLEARRKGALKE